MKTDKPRELSLRILRECEKGVFAEDLLAEARADFDLRDNAFITELVYGVLRNRARLDWSLDFFSTQPVCKTDDWTRNLLRLGAYQLLLLDKVPPSAAVNTSTDLAKQYGKKPGYVNGLLRNLERNKQGIREPGPDDPVKRLSIIYSHPVWLVKRWIQRFGAKITEQLLCENNHPAPLVIRTNTLRTTREQLKASLVADGAEARETRYSPVGLGLISSPGLKTLTAFREGWFIVQDEAAQLVSMMLDPRPGETILDACAAPGGKATHLAEMMNNQGELTALEHDQKRMARIRENSERLGATIIRPVKGDAATYNAGPFDKILIDAPCSGLGVLRRHPDGRWTKTEKNIKERQIVQIKILENCAGLLKPDGALVYATCTTEPEENEDVISAFLAKHPDYRLDDSRPFLPASVAGLVDDKGFFRTFPGALEMDGFFGVRLVRKE